MIIKHDSNAWHTFIPFNLFSQLIDILPKISTFLETLNSKFSCIEMWFTNRNFKPLLTKDKMNITLVIN